MLYGLQNRNLLSESKRRKRLWWIGSKTQGNTSNWFVWPAEISIWIENSIDNDKQTKFIRSFIGIVCYKTLLLATHINHRLLQPLQSQCRLFCYIKQKNASSFRSIVVVWTFGIISFFLLLAIQFAFHFPCERIAFVFPAPREYFLFSPVERISIETTHKFFLTNWEIVWILPQLFSRTTKQQKWSKYRFETVFPLIFFQFFLRLIENKLVFCMHSAFYGSQLI